MVVSIAPAARSTLLAHAEADPGREVCGLLLGQPGRIEAALSTTNVAADPARNFEIDPALLLRAHRDARGDRRRIIGHYHSHPNGDGRPSRRDAARASENGQIWLIIAAGTVTAWQAVAENTAAVHGRFVPVTLAPATRTDAA